MHFTGIRELRQMVQKAKNEGITINLRHAKILFCGASRAGKTSFSRLLRNKSYKDLESTPVGHTKQVLIAGKVNVVGSDWVNLDSNSETQALTERLYLILQYKENTEVIKSPLDDLSNTEPVTCMTDNEVSVKNVQLVNESINKSAANTGNDPRVDMNESASEDQTNFPEIAHDQQTTYESAGISQIEKVQSHKKVITEEEMANIPFLELKESISKTWDIFTLLDTGGQPEFINMLPAISSSTAITFVILNLSDGKNTLSKPIIAEYQRKGYEYDKYEIGYSNKDLLKYLFSSLKVTALGKEDFYPEVIQRVEEDKHPNPVVYIIGTCADILKSNMHERYDQKLQEMDERYDQELQEMDETYDQELQEMNERYDQELQEIDKEIKCLVELIEQDDKLVFKCTESGRYVNPIDNRTPRMPKDKIFHDDFGTQTIQRNTIDIISNIRQCSNEVLREKAQYEIPISWFILELELRKSDEVCISLPEVKQTCDKIMPSHRQMNLEQIKQVLIFYHQFGMLLYFHEVRGMNEFVITNPQWLFNNLTKIIMCKFECNATNSYGTNDIKKMQNGICDMRLLKKIDLDLHKIKLESFLRLLVYLKVIAPMDNNEYFIPNILPLCSNTETIFTEAECGATTVVTDDQQCKEVDPLLIQFNFGTIPRGLFGFLVVEILQQNSNNTEKYIPHGQNDVNNKILFRCANLIIFHVKPCFYISLIDKISYLELQVRSNKNEQSYHHRAQSRVTKALKKVCNRFDWSFSDCHYGFLCHNNNILCRQSPHLALLDSDKPFSEKYATCKNNHSTELNEAAHLIWFKVR